MHASLGGRLIDPSKLTASDRQVELPRSTCRGNYALSGNASCFLASALDFQLFHHLQTSFGRSPRETVAAARHAFVKGTVLTSRAISLECEAGRGRKDRESANAVSLSRARGGADTSRDRMSLTDPPPSSTVARGTLSGWFWLE